MRVWLWLVYKFTENYSLAAFLWIHSNSKEVSYLSWQNTYPNSKTTCHIKLKFFLWTKLLENLLLAKYLSVTAPLRGPLSNSNSHINWLQYFFHNSQCFRCSLKNYLCWKFTETLHRITFNKQDPAGSFIKILFPHPA